MSNSAAAAGGQRLEEARPAKDGPSGFNGSVFSLLERTEYRRCDSGEDMETIARLRYAAYHLRGDVPKSREQMVRDEHDDTPNCHRFGIFIDGRLISTVRLHHIDSMHPYGPVMKSFGDVLAPRIDRGDSFINPTMFAADPDLHKAYRALPYVTLRLAVIANSYFNSTSCVCAIRQDHAGFYRRIFGASQVGPTRSYPPFNVSVMMYASECAENLLPTLRRFPFFASTTAEQRMLFSPVTQGQVSPLTVLPTAKYLDRAA